MWFKHALGREIIEAKFKQGLPLNNLEVINIIFDREGVLFTFGIKGIPASCHKWYQDSMNSIVFHIKMLGVTHLDYSGNNHGLVIATPKIITKEDHSIIEISHEKLHLNCVAKELEILSVNAYIDDRWD